jgi:hypothetical protein
MSLFNRLDVHPSDADTLRLNVQAAKSGFDVPNTYDTSAQDQHQDIASLNIAPGYSRVMNSRTLFTANGFVRQDHLTYMPSADPFADTPATISQDRHLTNLGAKADLAMTFGNHNLKLGARPARPGFTNSSRSASPTPATARLPETMDSSIHRCSPST